MSKLLESRVRYVGRAGLPEDEIREIISSHGIYNGNADETARQLGYNKLTVIKYWNEKGLRALGRSRRYVKFKTPLDFFRSHKRYRSLTRSELAQEDPGLYMTLLRHCQLEEAIPNVIHNGGRPPLSKKEIDRIVKVYIQIGKINRTSKATGHSPPTVSKYLKARRIR
jgi:DNA invertase Pin-like site-specific DNA recombinase